MAPGRKRQRLSTDGDAVVTAAVQDQENKASQEKVQNQADKASSVQKHEAEKQHDDTHNNIPARRTLFVRSLPPSTTNESLMEFFSQSFPLKHATVVADQQTKKCKGYGFVTFADGEDAQRAIEEFDGQEFGEKADKKKIRVEIALPRHRDEGHSAKDPAMAALLKAKEEREKQKASQQHQPPPKLIVRNLPWSIKEPEQLAMLFRSYGKVNSATVPKKGPGLLAGFGFVMLRGRKNAEKALQGVNGKEVDGRTLAVDWAVDRDSWEKQQQQEEQTEEKADEEDGNESDATGVSGSEDEAEGEEEEHGEVSSMASEEADSDSDEDVLSSEAEGSEDEETEMSKEPQQPEKEEDHSCTLFVRNVPYTITDEDLYEHFRQFGPVRYARIVMDHVMERPKGTGFVCFYRKEDGDTCLRQAPAHVSPTSTYGSGAGDKKSGGKNEKELHLTKPSVLQDETVDSTGQYTLEGRVLQLSRAVNRNEATRLADEGKAQRLERDRRDKRCLYLLSEGTIPRESPLYQQLSQNEVKLREASAKQRKTLIEKNPTLHMSLTRLAVRNVPRSVTSKDLKQLAREAIVGFATDVKSGLRAPLSREELERGGEEMAQAEKDRKAKGKGVVKQAKIVFEGAEGGKVSEESGAGRSRGYGFIEYYSHRHALMGLRWLNCHAIDYQTKDTSAKSKKKMTKDELFDKKKRLIVEFAIENAQVVKRRKDKEFKARERAHDIKSKKDSGDVGDSEDVPSRSPARGGRPGGRGTAGGGAAAGKYNSGKGMKRKHDDVEDNGGRNGAKKAKNGPGANAAAAGEDEEKQKLAKRTSIIQKKRMLRRAKKKGKA
ncbi:RNA-binding domain-containing protein [Xylona heveae TC161]|uniref:RNA-binding domain-containing protein n=1 Tax=Xylona heveae (strain CBS 132557 / TC161) TaxID=1328760 RepID=A0A165JNB4_XYLHT|nr:RNA-binding domain-containing protein [Xylona heveae TC161]KZF26447.1 RNA-binding domain-containing protein [Xylona heveae TC161]